MCRIQSANLLVIPQRKAQNLNNPQNTSFPILCCLKGSVTSVSGHTLELKPDTLCVHGDNDEGVAAIREIRQLIHA